MIRTEETEALKHRISIIKDKIELKKQGFFEFGSTLEQLEASLSYEQSQLELAIQMADKNNFEEDFEFPI
jgi:hypothetical protein